MYGVPDQQVTVRRAVGDFSDLGTWTTSSYDEFVVSGSLQPVSGEYAQQFPEYLREQIHYVLYLPATEEVLRTAKDGTSPADRVIIDVPGGDTAEMVTLDRLGWQAAGVVGAHVRYALGKIEG